MIELITVGVVVAVIGLFYFILTRVRNLPSAGGGWIQSEEKFVMPLEIAQYESAVADNEHEDTLKKRLMKRAVAVIPHIHLLQHQANSEALYKKGYISEDKSMIERKDFVSEEYPLVMKYAEELREGWGEHIWRQANGLYLQMKKADEEKKSAEDPFSTDEGFAEGDEGYEENEGTAQASQHDQTKKGLLINDPNLTPEQRAEKMAKQLLKEEDATKGKKKKNLKGNGNNPKK
jgi:hypothetical protein